MITVYTKMLKPLYFIFEVLLLSSPEEGWGYILLTEIFFKILYLNIM